MAAVYALCDPVTREIRYIGKTVVKPRDRLRRHVWDALKGGTDWPVSRWIRKISQDPALLILEECDRDVAPRAEQVWIAWGRRVGLRLLNLTDGGDGMQGYQLSAETRAKIGAASRRRRVLSDETRQRMSAAARTRPPISDETRRKLAATSTGRVKSPETRSKLSASLRTRAQDPYVLADLREKAARMRQLKPAVVSVTTRERQSRALTALQNNPAYQVRKSEGLRRYWAEMTPEGRAQIGLKISAAKKGVKRADSGQ